jgi:hypothetical protein
LPRLRAQLPRGISERPRRRAESSDEFAPSKANAHLVLPCEPVDQAGDRGSRSDAFLGRITQVFVPIVRLLFAPILCRPVGAPPVINDRSPPRGFSGVGASSTPPGTDPPGVRPGRVFVCCPGPSGAARASPVEGRLPGRRRPVGVFPGSICVPHVSRQPSVRRHESISQRQTATSFISGEAISVTF